jgi:hypothetical protein
MRRSVRRALAVPLLAWCCASPAASADRDWTGSILEEDDFWAPDNRDRHYTHGIRFSVTSGDVEEPLWVQPFTWLGNATPAFADAAGAARRYNLILLGQNMFTPEDFRRFIPDPRDRPYAGWLYGGVGLMQDTPAPQARSPIASTSWR